MEDDCASQDDKHELAHTESDGFSSKFDGTSLSLDDISDHDSLQMSPATVSNRGKSSANKGKGKSNVLSSSMKNKRNKKIIDSNATMDIIIKEDGEKKVNIDVKHDTINNMENIKNNIDGVSTDLNTQTLDLGYFENLTGNEALPPNPVISIENDTLAKCSQEDKNPSYILSFST